MQVNSMMGLAFISFGGALWLGATLALFLRREPWVEMAIALLVSAVVSILLGSFIVSFRF